MTLQSISQILKTINPTSTTLSTGWDDLVKERKTKFNIDPLACSVASHRRSGSYSMSENKEHIVENDLISANSIREYYRKKYFWNSLKSNVPQSEYRINAQRLLSINEDWSLTDREVGFFVKLPCFYAEDTVYDQFREDLITNRETYSEKLTTHSSETKKLEFLTKTFRWQATKRVSYWFKDNNQYLYSFTTIDNHPFNKLFEEKIQTPQMFNFSRGIDNISDMWYNSIKSFEIIKEQNA